MLLSNSICPGGFFRSRIRFFLIAGMPDKFLYSARADRRNDHLMLTPQERRNHIIASRVVRILRIGSKLFGDDRTAHIHERLKKRVISSPVLCLNVI